MSVERRKSEYVALSTEKEWFELLLICLSCSVMRFLIGWRASQLRCHTLHKQIDAERSQHDAHLWSGTSQVIANDGMLAICIPDREKKPRGNTRLATATKYVRLKRRETREVPSSPSPFLQQCLVRLQPSQQLRAVVSFWEADLLH